MNDPGYLTAPDDSGLERLTELCTLDGVPANQSTAQAEKGLVNIVPAFVTNA